ncbi:MAG: aminotransferase class V-fold PLP-dependent enzyme [Pseudomonadota bacterium]
MEFKNVVDTLGQHVDPRVAGALFRVLRRIPQVQRAVDKEMSEVMHDLEASARPYRDRFASHARLPAQGVAREKVLADMRTMTGEENARWDQGYVSGAVYHGDPAHIEFLNQAYAVNSQSNPLHSDVWPSTSKYEAEIVSMTAHMLGSDRATDAEVCGAVTSGGTESILLAMKVYRDRARAEHGLRRAEIIAPVTAHAAFDKAAQYFGMKIVRTPVDEGMRANVASVRAALSRRTVAIVGSAPTFPHGIIDPIAELSELAREHGVGFHTDACLGGFVLPWARRLGYAVPPFDFELPGVTSMSADTHKYGYSAKGTSVVLYRDLPLRRFQYYTITDWPGGMYFSPTLAGSRPGALSAACWATLISLGEQGYLDATRRIVDTGQKIKRGVQDIPGLKVMGDPLWIIAFGSDELDVYRVMDQMTKRGWNLNGLHKPACVHLAVTLRHTQPGVAERFVDDLWQCVQWVRDNPDAQGGMAPVYGMAATLPVRSIVGDLLARYLDVLYRV